MITDISNLDVKRLLRRAGGITKKATIKETKYEKVSENLRMMQVYQSDWDSLADFRSRYKRVRYFHRGKQWEDSTLDDENKPIKEDEWIRKQGKLPLKQNIMRPLAKSLTGLFRGNSNKFSVLSRKPNTAGVEKMLTNALQYAMDINETQDIDARTFDLFILSGLPVQKIGYDFIDKYGRYDVIIEYIDPQYIFFNTDIKDVRLNDLRRIGQIHDATMDDLFVNFAKNEADKELLAELYKHRTREEITTKMGLSGDDNIDFYYPTETHKCRVIEVWEKKSVTSIEYWDSLNGEIGIFEGDIKELEAINQSRINMFLKNGIDESLWEKYLISYEQTITYKWFFKYLTPYGHVLREGETPYRHNMHPFIMYPYPLIGGEVWGVMEDVIDQQKYVNRLITLWDFIIGTTAKNTLILDKHSLDGQSPEKVASDYRQVGGVIVLDLKGGVQMPKELGGQLANLGMTELIGMQLKWMQDISGVQPAMQGQPGSAATPASKYAMEIQQTSLNSKDLLDSFYTFQKSRNHKILQVIVQFYRDKRYLAISGEDDSQLYDPDLISDSSDYDLVVSHGADSPTYKTWVDEMLKEFMFNGLIDLEMFLKHSNLPFANTLLEDIRNKREQMQAGEISPQKAVQGISQNFNQQAAQSGVDMNNMNRAVEMLNPNRG